MENMKSLIRFCLILFAGGLFIGIVYVFVKALGVYGLFGLLIILGFILLIMVYIRQGEMIKMLKKLDGKRE